jgi:3-oxoadipate enol-lactonase
MSGRVSLPHIALNTRLDGPEGAPWMVLSNSLGASLAMWDSQIPALTARYRVLRYDTRGHGASDVPVGPCSFADLTGDVIALMDHFGIETADFMGLSMGGMTGLGLALERPARFGKIVCADARADAPEPFRQMWDTRIAAVEAGGLEAIADSTLASWLTEEWRDANPAQVQAIRDMVEATDPQGYIACCRALQGLDYLKDLPHIRLPVLYLGGAQDMGAAPAVMRQMADETPGGIYVEIPGAAHVANINAPDAFNAAIGTFLGLNG